MNNCKSKTLLLVWVNYDCGFLIHNDYIKVPYNYDIKKVLYRFSKDLSRYNKIKNFGILNIMEV